MRNPTGLFRRLRSGLAGLMVAAVLATSACGVGTQQAPKATGSGSFSFTDDRGVTVTKPKSGLRVVAQEDAANALMHLGIKPVGIFGGAPLGSNPMLKGLDTGGIESVGEVFGEVKMEKLAALRPDVIVSTFYTGDGVLFPGGVYGFQTKKMQDDAQAIAPILALDSTKPSSSVIQRFSALAKALGATVDSGQVATWNSAVDDLKAAVKAHPGLRVLAVTPAQDQVFFAVPDLFPDLLDLRAWGVDVMKPTGKLVSSYYEAVSWENAARYQPDVVLVDTRGYTLGVDQLKKYPTWNEIKAVQAGQVGEWVRVSLNYQDYTARLQKLTAILTKAKAV
ncbi:iron complex transport system substrate-binding protein [Kribbella aluminosa]|uniref:Iron complex transport system substrate-binding protein n=1 Tax=Kribbella aluminosa TaxID=416017 RepID=A0ABS4UK55_9ACTN|nr:ABC transporter substrate-binding protein [Kribbella aluminosa]MBP2351990.1 iron complex transport system substrate-binding protein [Kribbella aluminosa]